MVVLVVLFLPPWWWTLKPRLVVTHNSRVIKLCKGLDLSHDLLFCTFTAHRTIKLYSFYFVNLPLNKLVFDFHIFKLFSIYFSCFPYISASIHLFQLFSIYFSCFLYISAACHSLLSQLCHMTYIM